MAHRFKAIFIATMAMAALGAVAAPAVQAVPEFHSHETKTTLTVRQDGTGKTAHQVIDLGANGGITCKKSIG